MAVTYYDKMRQCDRPRSLKKTFPQQGLITAAKIHTFDARSSMPIMQ
jgi:hypothetical protein